jgi:hypothetical protein
MSDYFGIGLTADSITSLEDLPEPIMRDSAAIQWQYLPYQISKRMGDGSMDEYGPPSIIWVVQLMNYDERNSLKSFCPGASADVFIHSPKADKTWGDFACTIIWPDNDMTDVWYGHRKNLTIQFINAVEVEGS